MLSDTRARASTILAVLAALTLAACGGGESASPAERTPADAPVYGEAVVRPEGDLQANIDEILASFPEGEQVGDQITRAIEEDSDGEIVYEEDIEPWLGERAGAFGLQGEGDEFIGASLVEATDEEAAREFLDQLAEGEEAQARDYEGVELLVDDEGFGGAVFDGLLVLGQEQAIQAAIDTREDGALGEEERYTEATERSDEETRLAFGVIDIQTLVEAVPESELGIPPEDLTELIQGSGGDPSIPAVFAVSIEEGLVRFEQSAGGESTGGDALAELPGDSILAFALSELPPGLSEGFEVGFSQGLEQSGVSPEEGERLLEQEFGFNPAEMLDSIEALGVFVRGGGTDLGGAFFAELGSENEVTDLLQAAQSILAEEGARLSPLSDAGAAAQPGANRGESGQGGQRRQRGGRDGQRQGAAPDAAGTAGASGFTVDVDELPFPLVVTGEGSQLFVATSPEQAAAARGEDVETLEDSGQLDEAAELLGDGFEPTLIADGNALVSLLGAAAAGDPELQEALPYLQPIGRIAAGSQTEGELVISRTAIEIE